MELLKIVLGMGALIIVLTSPIWLVMLFRARVRQMEIQKLGRPVERALEKSEGLTLWEER